MGCASPLRAVSQISSRCGPCSGAFESGHWTIALNIGGGEAWGGSSGEVRLPPLIGNPREFVLGFFPCVQRRIGRSGISLHGLKYWDPALTPLINSNVDHRVCYNQRDLSRVYLRCKDAFVDIPLIQRTRAGFALWELKEARAYLRTKGRSASNESELLDAIDAQREIQRAAASSTKSARRRSERRPHSPVPPPASVDYADPVKPLDEDGIVW